jgi:hypothetical protein
MTPQTPYTADLGGREPIAAMREAAGQIRSLTAGWTPQQFERPYAPGKWTARQVLIHLAQSEIAFGNRARMALAGPGYTSQSWDQDQWMAFEGGAAGGGPSGALALEAFLAMNALNCALFESLSAERRATPFSHPDYGALTVDWLIHQMAGHVRHHVPQIHD